MVVVLALVGCSMINKPTPALAPIANPNLQHVVDLLETGKAQAADGELHALLEASPESRPGKYLLAQIETPIAKLYPGESFTVKLSRDESLSSLARKYLGNSLAFFGLARFNNIPVPAKVAFGQSVRIPKTAEALAALSKRSARPPAPVAALPVPAEPAKVHAEPASAPAQDQHATAEDWYRRGVVAFQQQDLDGAIADWDKSLAIEPDNKEAQLNRAQAVRLRTNLANLMKKPATR
jgi:tetratricopeptide (TPR) repeat protein